MDTKKTKLFTLLEILHSETDDEHFLSLVDIQKKLAERNIKVERKTLYKDIEALREYGYDIIMSHDGRHRLYHFGAGKFEIAELKLLVDLIQSSKFITKKKSVQLIKKIESMTSKYEANQLKRQVFIAGRVKTENESIYYNVDILNEAINQNCMIEFQYFQWDENKQRILRHDGKVYKVSPWMLLWDNENYYLIAFDEEYGEIRHYRVDKILNISILPLPRKGKEKFNEIDLGAYANSKFGMFSGKKEKVEIQFHKSLSGVMIDRFGTKIAICHESGDYYYTEVEVSISDQFLGWILALGNEVKITGPDNVVDQMRNLLEERAELYK